MTARGPRIIVAHEDAIHRKLATEVLRAAGHRVVAVGDGRSAEELLWDAPAPAALVVDVALTDPPFYRLCQVIRDAGLATRTVLVSSVYSKTAYKRRATELYGADDYVEQHHLADSLVGKVEALLAGRAFSGPAPGTRRPEQEPLLEDAAERRLWFEVGAAEDSAQAVRRLARVIVSDMLLYVAREVGEWRERDFEVERMPERLRAGVEEARRLLSERVPADVELPAGLVLEVLGSLVRAKVDNS